MSRNFEYCRKLAIDLIEDSLKRHENNEFFAIGDVDELAALLDEKDIEEGALLDITHEFLSGWGDSAAHYWNYYEPLKKDDWPRLAKIILSDLKANREITDPQIISQFHFIKEPRISIIARIKSIINKI